MSVQLGKKENKLTDRPENVLVIGGNPVQAVMLCRQLLFLDFLIEKRGKNTLEQTTPLNYMLFLPIEQDAGVQLSVFFLSLLKYRKIK